MKCFHQDSKPCRDIIFHIFIKRLQKYIIVMVIVLWLGFLPTKVEATWEEMLVMVSIQSMELN